MQEHCNIALAGFMGTGKSTVGRLIAARLGWRLIDTDSTIEAEAGCSIAEIFAQQGEAAFRALETRACASAVAGCHRVIALGGGALLNPATRERIAARGLLICLDADLDTLIARVGDDPARPLFSDDREQLADLFNARAAHYASLPHHVDTSHTAPDAVAEEVLTLWAQYRQP